MNVSFLGQNWHFWESTSHYTYTIILVLFYSMDKCAKTGGTGRTDGRDGTDGNLQYPDVLDSVMV